MTKTLNQADLAQYTGSENWYRHAINRAVLFAAAMAAMNRRLEEDACARQTEHSHKGRRAQWVDATLSRSLSAGVIKPKVSLGLWFSRSATPSKCAWE
jgi:hypothetical protein